MVVSFNENVSSITTVKINNREGENALNGRTIAPVPFFLFPFLTKLNKRYKLFHKHFQKSLSSKFLLFQR